MFVPHFSATAFFYDTKKNIMGFYYAGEIQFICPYENIVKFTYGQGTPTTINTRTPITSVGFNSQGINSVGVGSISQQKTLNSTLAYATLTYRTETGEIKTFALDFSVASRYQAQGCKDIDDLNCIQNADMGALLNILNKIDAKIAGFIELGKDIVDGKITPDKFDKTDYIKKNVEFKKEYNIFLSAIEEETKKDNIAHLIGSIIFWGLIIGIAIFLIVFIIQNMDSIEIYY